ncbi:hypothetical protein D3C75_1019850 [compost metagenome]
MLGGKCADRIHDTRQCRGLVVGQISEDRDERAIAIEELGIPSQRGTDLRGDQAFVIADGHPLGIAFKSPRGVGPHAVHQRAGLLNAGHLGQQP